MLKDFVEKIENICLVMGRNNKMVTGGSCLLAS
jgi:hypothetical protein